jgi:hypothetical protein
VKRAKGPAWRAEVERRLAALEGALKLERASREQQGAQDDEEMQTIHETLTLIREEHRGWELRLAWLEERFSAAARRPPRPPTKR